jgi:hypothetical protein
MAAAIKLLDTDPRRAGVGIVHTLDINMSVCIGRSQAEAESGDGFEFTSNAHGMKRFRFTEELWIQNRSAAPAAGVRVSIYTEQWSR